MRAAVIFEKLIEAGDVLAKDWTSADLERYPERTVTYSPTNTTALITYPYMYLLPGTYTLSAETPEGVTCKVYTWNHETGAGSGQFPANDGEGSLPYTFTVSAVSDVKVGLNYAGWKTQSQGGTRLLQTDVSNIRLHDVTHRYAGDTYETAVLRPDEIAENDILAQAKNSKSNVNLTIFPTMEAWGFCERSITYVTIFDLDLPQDRMIFYGRVTGVKSSMTGGKHSQEVTCVSALDFLEDTAAISTAQASGVSADMKLNDYLTAAFLAHNKEVDWKRKLTVHSAIADTVWMQRITPQESTYTTLTDLITKGEKLYWYVDGAIIREPIALEFRERYTNGIPYMVIANSIGYDRDTAILIGDNLREISVDKSIDSGIYSSINAISGVNHGGGRYMVTVDNAEMYAKYGGGHVKIVAADNIRCTSPQYEEVYNDSGGYWVRTETQAYIDMKNQLAAYARSEAAKLSDPPVKITLAAEDLAAMGYSGYEPFELYNSYPVVCPKIGLYGERLRITQIRRRLCDGRIESITIEKGQQLLNAPSSAPASAQAAKTQTETTKKTSEEAEAQAEITQSAIEDANDGGQLRFCSKPSYDQLHHNPHTLYVVDNNGTNELYIGDDHISSGGGGGTIENAVILTGEQESEWALDHQMVDVDFRGGCSMWYGGIPARIVVQGLRVLVQVDEEDIVPDDLMTELTLEDCVGVSLTYKCIISSLTASAGYAKIMYYHGGQYAGETGAYSIGAGAGFTEKTFGMVLLFGGWTLYGNDLFPILDMAFCYIIDGIPHRTSAFGLPGNYLTNPMICTAAERGFGTTLLQRTEPSS